MADASPATHPESISPLFEVVYPQLDPAIVAAARQRFGHCVVRGLLREDAVARLYQTTRGALGDVGLVAKPSQGSPSDTTAPTNNGYDDPRWIALQQRLLIHPDVAAITNDARVLAVATALLGTPPGPRQGEIVRVGWPHRFGLTTAPHQDHHYIGGTTNRWTVWVPLHDCPLSLGPIQVLAGSHLHGPVAHDRSDHGESLGVVQCPPGRWHGGALKAGDAVFFHCLTIHGATPNQSNDQLRLSLDFRVADPRIAA